MTGVKDPYKRAAIECWTGDPCGANVSDGAMGTRAYFQRLLDARSRYAPWLASALGYTDTKGKRVLDVGSGQGIDLAHFALEGARAVGIDLTPRHVELTRAHLAALSLEAETLIADAERLPFRDQAFDWISSNGVLHHTPDIRAALREIRRVLRPGGEIRVVLYNRSSVHYWIGQVVIRGILQGRLLRSRSMADVLSDGVEHSRSGGRPLVRVYSPAKVAQLLREAGLHGVHVEVRHLGSERLAGVLERLAGVARAREIIERAGRIAGWYIVARGVA